MPMRGGLLQRKCACGGTPERTGENESCREKKLQRRSENLPDASSVSKVPPIVHDVLRSAGQPLDSQTRAFMEPRFGHDFSRVRVHADERAAESASAVNAQAYTVGRDLVFARDQFQPGTTAGARLLAHELSHVVQQENAPGSSALGIGAAATPLEEQANHAAGAVVSGGHLVGVMSKCSSRIIQRQEVPTFHGPPVFVGADKKAAKEKQKISDDLIVRLPGVAQLFLDEWFMAMSGGINSVPEPEDPESSVYWWAALAGNLTWAATTLLAPELVLPIRAMSFAGAAVGSGALQKATATGMPAGKSALLIALAKARDAMKKSIRLAVEDVAIAAASKKITTQSKQDEMLWIRLFPGVPYDNQFETIVTTAIASASSALEDFAKQYDAWRSQIRTIVNAKRTKENPFTGNDIGERAARGGYFIRPMDESERSEAENQLPFDPQLKFTMPSIADGSDGSWWTSLLRSYFGSTETK
jgi:hypothetical protein